MPADAFNPSDDANVIVELLIALFNICLEIIKLEFDVSTSAIFFFGNLENKPLFLEILGTFILNGLLVDIPAANKSLFATPTTVDSKPSRVNVAPSADIALTLLMV